MRCTLFDGLDHDDSYILFDGKRHWQVSYILYFVVNELSAEKNLEELQAAACNDPALQERIPEETMQQVLEFMEKNYRNPPKHFLEEKLKSIGYIITGNSLILTN